MTTTKIDIFSAEGDIADAAATAINRILGEEGAGQSVSITDIHILGHRSIGFHAARYFGTAMRRFTITAELTEGRIGFGLVLHVDDGNNHHRTTTKIKL